MEMACYIVRIILWFRKVIIFPYLRLASVVHTSSIIILHKPDARLVVFLPAARERHLLNWDGMWYSDLPTLQRSMTSTYVLGFKLLNITDHFGASVMIFWPTFLIIPIGKIHKYYTIHNYLSNIFLPNEKYSNQCVPTSSEVTKYPWKGSHTTYKRYFHYKKMNFVSGLGYIILRIYMTICSNHVFLGTGVSMDHPLFKSMLI